MSTMDDHGIERTADGLRRQAARRSASTGPLTAVAWSLSEYCDAARQLLAVVNRLAYELELLDGRLRVVFGQRWWDDMSERLRTHGDGEGGGDERSRSDRP